jgi:hypothetical protein
MAPRSGTTGWRFALMTAVCLALSPAGDAAARKFQMSGTWVMRNGQVFIPLQFAAAGMNGDHTSMGNLTGAFGFPNGPIPGAGGVTATGSAPASLRIPRHRFVEDVMALIPLYGVTLVQITTNFGLDAPFATATLGPGAGPGSFTWCPEDPACVARGGMRSTDPPQGAGRNGRVIYRAGPNQFGGAMQMGLKRGGDNVFLFNSAPFQAGHNIFGSAPGTRRLAVGSGSADHPVVEMVFLRRGVVTQPTMAPPHFSPILYPGPKLTTMLGLTTTGSGMVFYLPTLTIGPMGTPVGQFTTGYGFGQTTGTIFVQMTAGYAFDVFTFMGSDQRTPLGAGNLSLVAGGLSFRNTLAGQTPYVSIHKTWLTLAPPIPSVSPGGLVATGALVLLAAGYALRRRLA